MFCVFEFVEWNVLNKIIIVSKIECVIEMVLIEKVEKKNLGGVFYDSM